MNIGIMSDIHSHRPEQGESVDELVSYVNSNRNLDLLVCAGDISHVPSDVRTFLAAIRVDCPKVWVPGNHDIWVIEAESACDTSRQRYATGFREISHETGWHYLPSSPLRLEPLRVGVVGTIGWFTGHGYSEWFDTESSDADHELACAFAQQLEQDIESVANAEKLIVVTHHLSTSRSLPSEEIAGADCNVYVEQVLQKHATRILLAIHGHKHIRYGPKPIDGIPFVAHPFGYPHQHSSPTDGFRMLSVA